MSFALRSLSARRYRVEGSLPTVHDADFARRLTDRKFQPLAPLEERAFGWVSADNCLDARFTAGSVAPGPCAVFALRVDRRRVNSRLLRAMLDLELRGRKKDAEATAEGAPAPRRGTRVSRDEKTELRRALTEELLRNTTPTMEVHPVVLYPRDGVVLFGALSKPANEVFRTLFADTFDVSLSALTPFHRALELLEGRGGEALAALRRTSFVPGPSAQVADRLRVTSPADVAAALRRTTQVHPQVLPDEGDRAHTEGGWTSDEEGLR
jgi:hypothetical protein